MRALLASGNRHKLGEFRLALPGWEIDLLDAPTFPPEDGSTYAENARGKAAFGHRLSPGGDLVIGEDSGIELAALGGRPGLESARWADDGVGRLLEELAGVDDRRARYVCVIVAIATDGTEIVVEGSLPGSVATTPSGKEGFGYDPVFVPDGERLTVAELGDAWKAQNSHRSRAARSLATAVAGSLVASIGDDRERGTG